MKACVLSVFSVLLLSLAPCPPAMAAVLDRTNVCEAPYNAIPNDGLPDTAAIQAAVNAGRSIYFPPGIYIFQGLLTLQASSSYRLYGDGPGVSTIIFTGSNAGISGQSMGPNSLNVEGLTLEAGCTGAGGAPVPCGTAISARFEEIGSNTKFRSATIHNVQIIGSARSEGVGETGTYWTHGIYLYQAQNAVIDNLEISGNIRPSPEEGMEDDATLTGIVWESSSNIATTGLHISDLEVKFLNTALRTNGWVEGLYMNRFEIVQCGQHGMPAVDLNSTGPAGRKPTFHLTNGHVDLIQNGIQLSNLSGIKITKVLFLHNGGAEVDGTMVILNNCFDATISQCSFIGGIADRRWDWDVALLHETGILLNDADSVQIVGNYFTHMGVNEKTLSAIAIAVQPTSSVVRIVNNLFEVNGYGYDGVRTCFDDPGAVAYHRDNNCPP